MPQSRNYPAHVYRMRFAERFKFSVIALVFTVLAVSFSIERRDEALAFVLIALSVWVIALPRIFSRDRYFVCVDRDGVEISSFYRTRRIEWPEIARTEMLSAGYQYRWMLNPVLGPATVLRLWRQDDTVVLIGDGYDDAPASIREHIERYRLRYGPGRATAQEDAIPPAAAPAPAGVDPHDERPVQ